MKINLYSSAVQCQCKPAFVHLHMLFLGLATLTGFLGVSPAGEPLALLLEAIHTGRSASSHIHAL